MKIGVYSFILLMVITSCKDNTVHNLSDHEWEVISINDTELSGTLPILSFDLEKGKVNGNGGCNNFFGNVEIMGSSIKFGMMGSTKMMCVDMTNEDLLFNNLDKVNSYTFENGLLILSSENNAVSLKLHHISSTA